MSEETRNNKYISRTLNLCPEVDTYVLYVVTCTGEVEQLMRAQTIIPLSPNIIWLIFSFPQSTKKR